MDKDHDQGGEEFILVLEEQFQPRTWVEKTNDNVFSEDENFDNLEMKYVQCFDLVDKK